MSNRLQHISSNVILSTYILKSGKDEFFDEDLAKIYLDEGIDELLTADSLSMYVFHKELYNSKAQLPSNFRFPLGVTYRGCNNSNELLTRTTVSQYIERSIQDACDITVDVKCKKCNTNRCTCEDGSYPIEIDTTATVLASNPELSVQYTKFLIGYSNSNSPYSNFSNKFRRIKPALNYYHNLPNKIKNCLIPDLDRGITYNIDNGIIEVNTNDNNAEVLMSYLGVKTDDQGFLMIPSQKIVSRALEFYLRSSFALRQYEIKQTQSTRAFWKDMDVEATKIMHKAKHILRIPDEDQWDSILSNSWLKRIPNDPYSNYTNDYMVDKYSPLDHTTYNF